MDIVLRATDDYFFTPYVYPQSWQRDDIWRQIISLSLIVNIGGYLLYIIPTTLDYLFIFDKSLMKHPQFMKDQVKLEIFYASKSIPLMGALTTIVFLFEVRGYSKLYDNWNDTPYGVFGMGLSILSFMFFNDMMIYWIHRFLHYRWFYKYIHKDHHKWKIPSPFASHAFHPIDGFLQSTPYHIYPFLFPLHKATYLVLFICVNLWTVSIHDGDFRVPKVLQSVVNGSAHHLDHHVYYNYNYGQYLTLWDRIGGSFRNPSSYEGKGPKEDVHRLLVGKAAKAE
ncbi:PREDICTED: lathosterol oxidase-like isoform X1 [Priapulus caudatus]|uniref:Lathosterol oxidase-like isoform X1 n=1 Tax=Priapulus caudatus TaxID=37621 RepID=A0ABM1DN65_PRICU|nr:PREDICTED: lathosterol oxidase-like isoform X1 [Priapulus caudatus]XP_014661385.1 PREDICTED: lathosterol oxidase-like isoform X1 [Priapulus caudatus]XP_014661386.1 PREDICTED: lathosterol oxidase-like isoform X1 [Priapulus caudatus]